MSRGDRLSTRAGTWVLLKVRTDDDPDVAGRIRSAQRGTGDPHRTIRALAAKMNSSNTVVVLRDDP